MRWIGWSLLLALNGSEALAQACVVHSQAERLDVKVCQPNLPSQKVEVQYVDQCPTGAFGVCSNAQVANMPYRQDIHYYGVATDAAYLKPFCETRSQGTWLTP